MARLEAVAAGLYYPTPEPVVEAIAHMLRIDAPTTHYASSVRILDPCVGTGRAVTLLAERLCARATHSVRLMRPDESEVTSPAAYSPSHQEPVRVELYGIELNRTRAQTAAAQCFGGVLTASFFTTSISEASFSLAFVNPPYDDDYVSGGGGRRVRLEIQFLKRVTHKLLPEGILIWIVPQARLAEAASYLASSYDRLACWRFPDEPWKAPDAPASAEPLPMYAAFQQVVLLGRRRFNAVPLDAELVGTIEDWSRQGAALPVLPSAELDRAAMDDAGAGCPEPPYMVPLARGQAPTFEAWAYDPDATARQVSLPGSGVWHQPTYCEQRWPHLDTTDLGIGRPPMPLREGHLSLLVASGGANGLVVVGKGGWRALVKGGSITERCSQHLDRPGSVGGQFHPSQPASGAQRCSSLPGFRCCQGTWTSHWKVADALSAGCPGAETARSQRQRKPRGTPGAIKGPQVTVITERCLSTDGERSHVSV